LFSVELFYHFAFLAISVALLGLGAGGVFAYLRRNWLARFETRRMSAILCTVNALGILLTLEVVLHVPVSLELSRWNLLRLTAIYLTSTVPFFFTGLVFSVVFARETHHVTRLYGADLLGGALACLAVVPLLNWLGGPNAILFAALVSGTAAAVWGPTPRAKKLTLGLSVVLALGIALNFSGRLFDIICLLSSPSG